MRTRAPSGFWPTLALADVATDSGRRPLHAVEDLLHPRPVDRLPLPLPLHPPQHLFRIASDLGSVSRERPAGGERRPLPVVPSAVAARSGCCCPRSWPITCGSRCRIPLCALGTLSVPAPPRLAAGRGVRRHRDSRCPDRSSRRRISRTCRGRSPRCHASSGPWSACSSGAPRAATAPARADRLVPGARRRAGDARGDDRDRRRLCRLGRRPVARRPRHLRSSRSRVGRGPAAVGDPVRADGRRRPRRRCAPRWRRATSGRSTRSRFSSWWCRTSSATTSTPTCARWSGWWPSTAIAIPSTTRCHRRAGAAAGRRRDALVAAADRVLDRRGRGLRRGGARPAHAGLPGAAGAGAAAAHVPLPGQSTVARARSGSRRSRPSRCRCSSTGTRRAARSASC
mgnify:CR=1 FL=1